MVWGEFFCLKKSLAVIKHSMLDKWYIRYLETLPQFCWSMLQWSGGSWRNPRRTYFRFCVAKRAQENILALIYKRCISIILYSSFCVYLLIYFWYSLLRKKYGLVYFGLFYRHLFRACPRCAGVKTLDYEIVESDFEHQSRYCVHFRTITLRKRMNTLILPAMR